LKEIAQYLFKSVDEILKEFKLNEWNLFDGFKDYFDIPQVQLVISILGLLTCKLLISNPLNNEICNTMSFKKQEILENSNKLETFRSEKNDLTLRIKYNEASRESLESRINDISESLRTSERELKTTTNKEDVEKKIEDKRTEKEKLESDKSSLVESITNIQTQINKTDREIQNLEDLIKDEKSKEFKKLVEVITKLINEFQIDSDFIMTKMFEDFSFNCPHLVSKHEIENKEMFDQSDYAFNKYYNHVRQCSLRFLKHALNNLISFKINKDTLSVNIEQIKNIFENFKEKLNSTVVNFMDNTDSFAKHFFRINNLLTIFLECLKNSSENIVALNIYYKTNAETK
jgi:hypothetical protein